LELIEQLWCEPESHNTDEISDGNKECVGTELQAIHVIFWTITPLPCVHALRLCVKLKIKMMD
jgi:hypothetical protein